MRLAIFVCLLAAACATTRGTRVSAAAMNMPPCPADVRSSVEGIDPAEDWRQVNADGVRYCVPSSWYVPAEELRKTNRRPSGWFGREGGVYVMRTSTVEMDFSRNLGPDMVSGFQQLTIGGQKAELWHRANPPQSDIAVQERYKPSSGGYQTYAVWRDLGVYFQGGARTLKGVAVQRQIFQTARFDAQ